MPNKLRCKSIGLGLSNGILLDSRLNFGVNQLERWFSACEPQPLWELKDLFIDPHRICQDQWIGNLKILRS